ncbi:class E sortase [Leifsonia sp. Leaf264]|uniref:class E sortase n=1 Tax=Leifsonia sp. Leaf264 TaxID=1736314 RepID=UPI000A6C5D4D|nr:class E sortase [Leifsonia sp. Leaf264]
MKPSTFTLVCTAIGEVLISGAVLLLMFVGWKLGWQDVTYATHQSDAAAAQSEAWIAAASEDVTPHSAEFGDPTVGEAPQAGTAFAVLYVPRYGPDYRRTIAEGFGAEVLNSFDLGIGHYPGTQMPGDTGNFAIAGHRSAYGGAMHLIDQLVPGDPIIVQTADGWYTYRFRSERIISPDKIDVIWPVPGAEGAEPTERLITLTTCNPLYSSRERIAAVGVLESWRPLSAGPPGVIAAQVAAQN